MNSSRLSPAKITGAWIFFVVSIAFPPLLIISIPVLLVTLGQVYARYRLVKVSRDFYNEERNLMNQSKLWRSR